MATVYHTADLHLGHRLVAGHRGFDIDVFAHDLSIADHWSDIVKPDDIVYVHGDVAMGPVKAGLALLAELPGRKRLTTGNHDKCHPMFRDAYKHMELYSTVFEYIAPFGRRKIAGQNVLLSHYPYHADRDRPARDVQYRLQDHGAFLLHGHTHQAHVWTSQYEIHVGWDTWERLVPEHEIAALIEERMST
jgi:calcineurin-like phosphoesterase family protein